MSAAKLLVVDDDPQFRRFMRSVLTAERYAVSESASGEEALEELQRGSSDAVLLDLALPGMNGIETCRAIRSFSDVALILLSGHRSESEKIAALDAGADDYITKPFSTQEFLARVRAVLRRAPLRESPRRLVRSGDLEIDFAARRVTVAGKAVHLTRKEFALLDHLAATPNVPIAHRRLLEAVWGPESTDKVFYLRTFVNQLRKKIESEPTNPRIILTEPRFGYRFNLPLSD